MTILAIDPGPEKSAFIQIAHVGGNIRALEHRGHCENANLRAMLIEAWHDAVVCEMIASYGMPVGMSIFSTVRWIGRYEEICHGRHIQFHTLFRRDVKSHLCGSMRAKDGNVRQALIDKLGPPGTKKQPGTTYGLSGDMWQALAVGITFLETATHISRQ